MTRKGKLPIPVPPGVDVKINAENITVKGPKGTIVQQMMPCIDAKLENNVLTISLNEENDQNRRFHGLYRTIIDNMIEGTTKGFKKSLEMIGVGFRAAVQGNNLNLQLGFSHPTNVEIPKEMTVTVEKNTVIQISGVDKQKIGQFAASIRALRPPEPYQGKGIRYEGEYVRRKAGKAGSK